MILSDYHFMSGSVSRTRSGYMSWSRYGSRSESSTKSGLTDLELVIQKVLDE